MRLRSGMILALGAGLLVLSGCAPAAAPAGPTASPTGRVYEPGIAPTETDLSQQALLRITQQRHEEALALAQQGIAQDSTNAVYYFLAGQAHIGLGDYDAADRMFDRAEELYPAYEIEIEPERATAWETAFRAGIEAYTAGNLDEAAQWWNRANLIYNVQPEGYINLGVVHSQRGEFDEAIEAYRQALAALEREPATRELTPEEVAEREESRVTVRENLVELLLHTEQFAEAEALIREQLEVEPDDPIVLANLAMALARQGRTDEAQEIYRQLLSQPDLTPVELFNIGVALFNSDSYEQAEEAFRRVAEALPNSRDAWFNYASALYAQDDYEALVPVGERLLELDPLNETSSLILAEAYREVGQNQRSLEVRQRHASLPVHVDALQMMPRPDRTRVSGVVVGNQAPAGTPIELRFTFYGQGGEVLGTQTVTVSAPATDEQAQFEVVLESEEPAAAYSYELLP